MTAWNRENTEAFTAADLEALNEAQTRLEAANPNVDPSNISDRLNNAWFPGATASELVDELN